jgi:hypothetical protein
VLLVVQVGVVAAVLVGIIGFFLLLILQLQLL